VTKDQDMNEITGQPAPRFVNRTVLITGAASGLGLAVARQFAAEGANLVLVDWSGDALDAAVDSFERLAHRVAGVQGDVADAATASDAVAAAVESFGRIDVLINNAAIDPMGARSLVETTEEQWDAILDTNLKGAFLFSRATIPVMKSNGGGAIVNTASSAGLKASSQEAAYGISKAALIAMTRALARDFAADAIRVNSICPGFLEAMPSDRRRGVSDEVIAARSARAASLVPMGREGTYEEVARSVLFLASDESSYTTGAALVMDGGYLA
jgi:NAD(P)-dependent dehydrogenase (short-subunit alcohol dehydrogenase family)